MLKWNSTSGKFEATNEPTDTSDHTLLSNIGTYSHDQIDSHIADTTLHFSKSSINFNDLGDIQLAVVSNKSTLQYTEDSTPDKPIMLINSKIYQSNDLGLTWVDLASNIGIFNFTSTVSNGFVGGIDWFAYTSNDLVSWTSQGGIGVYFSNGNVCFAGASDRVIMGGGNDLTYSDPPYSTWTLCSGVGVEADDLAYNNGVYIAIHSHYPMRSTDGITFTKNTTAETDIATFFGTYPNSWAGFVAYGNSTWVATNRYKMYSVDDGLNWTVDQASSEYWGVVFFNGYFYCLRNSVSPLVRSADGISWANYGEMFQKLVIEW
eukprot:TRINITY_DN4513_c0_g1_i1.p2 TRINITY_DN4513_c0_g1~~TRINITY_DN4513_c0_g1_i1.p2  ORF type:complete len:319 (+),score=0.81 TRINITY_DN4513_c0_g1_i1:989-1945(+)